MTYRDWKVSLSEHPDDVTENIFKILEYRNIRFSQSIFFIKCTGASRHGAFEFHISMSLDKSHVVVYFQQYTGDTDPCNEVVKDLKHFFGITDKN